MTKCPHCGSTAQVREWDADYFTESQYEIVVVRKYHCGCGCDFTGTTVYRIDGEEEIEENC